MLVLDLVTALRRDVPGLGTRKLHLLIAEPLAQSGIKLGRDKLHKILQTHALIIRQGRQTPQTTDSNHRLHKYPNLLIDRVITAPKQVWVSDITYLYIGLGFGYSSLITDAYSKLIVGYCLHPFLTAEGSLKALDMALATHLEREQEMIHHSDRGSQYCSFDYVRKLKGANILISMTQQGDPYENAIAERVNGILKTDFRLNRVFVTFEEAEKAVEKSIYNYNHLRPHMNGPPLRLWLPDSGDGSSERATVEKALEAEGVQTVKASSRPGPVWVISSVLSTLTTLYQD